MMPIDKFILQINDFDNQKSSRLIDFFAYYLLKIKNLDSFDPTEIQDCYNKLDLKSYSNIRQYLLNALRGKKPKYLRKGNSYVLSRHGTQELEKELQVPRKVNPSDDFFTLDILKGTRGYIEKIGEQILICYDVGAYDGSLVLLRKLIETFIIELFEKFKLERKIKDKDNNYLHLRDLIPKLIKEESWNLSRNVKSALPKIKKYGDLSAHNRRFSADKKIIDSIKDDVRILFQEFINLIDYSNPYKM